MTYDDLRIFIVLWYQCRTLAEFVERSQMDRRGASNVAAYLRQKGVKLPAMPRGLRMHTKGLAAAEWERLRRIAENEGTAVEVARRYKEAV